jgi:hypothetical protein
MSLLPAAPAAEISAAAESFTDVVSQSTSPAPQPPVRAGAAIAGLALAIWPQPLRRTVVAVGKRLRRAGILAAFLR